MRSNDALPEVPRLNGPELAKTGDRTLAFLPTGPR